MEYSFWMVWGRTFEGDRRWFMARTPIDWDADMVFERAREGLWGGVGGDFAEILEVEWGYENDIYTDYIDSV